MPFTQRYEHSYGISLLDDLHNLFPEILYDPHRFQQNDLVQFLRERISSLFDVEFARNRAYYRLYIQPLPQTPPPRTPARSPPPIQRRTYRVPLTVPLVAENNTLNEATDTMNIITTLLGGLGGVGGLTGFTTGLTSLQTADLQDLLTPVVVHPSEAEIHRATILSSVEPPATVVCAICQDHAPPSGPHEWRILRSCTHRFHKNCIDTWFRQNVHCPICRHDIREEPAP